MNVAIITHSLSGTTKEFADIIAAELAKNSHTVEQTLIETDPAVKSGGVNRCRKFTIKNLPDCSRYDIVFVGGPVWAFSASPVIIECLKNLKGIGGKKVVPFVTMGFPYEWLGGRSAISLMSKTAMAAGAAVHHPGVIIPKMFRNFKKNMREGAAKMTASV